MNQALDVVLLGIVAAASLNALLLSLSLLFESFVTAIEVEAEERHSRSFFTGLINVLFFVVIVVVIAGLAENTGLTILWVPAILLGVIFVVGLLFGLAGMGMMMGQRLLPDREVWRRSMWGGVLIILACVTPYLGWFLLFPYLAMRGFGAFVRTGISEIRARRVRPEGE